MRFFSNAFGELIALIRLLVNYPIPGCFGGAQLPQQSTPSPNVGQFGSRGPALLLIAGDTRGIFIYYFLISNSLAPGRLLCSFAAALQEVVRAKMRARQGVIRN